MLFYKKIFCFNLILLISHTLTASISDHDIASIPTLQSLCLAAKNSNIAATEGCPWSQIGLGNWYAQQVAYNIEHNKKNIDPLPGIIHPIAFAQYLSLYRDSKKGHRDPLPLLHKAASKILYHIKYINFLIDAHIDVNQKTKFKSNALEHAYSIEAVEKLIAAGIDINAKNFLGKTPLYYAVSTDIVQLLIHHGADINQQDFYQETLLHYRVKSNLYDEIIELLINAHANLNLQNKYGDTPLHMAMATENGSIKAIEMLISAGANLTIENEENLTALQCAYNQERRHTYHQAIACKIEQNKMLHEDLASRSICKKRKSENSSLSVSKK